LTNKASALTWTYTAMTSEAGHNVATREEKVAPPTHAQSWLLQ